MTAIAMATICSTRCRLWEAVCRRCARESCATWPWLHLGWTAGYSSTPASRPEARPEFPRYPPTFATPKRYGSSAVVANVNVVGSNPITRFPPESRPPTDNCAPVAFFVPYLLPAAKLATPATVGNPVPSRGQPCPAPDCCRAPRSAPVRSCAPQVEHRAEACCAYPSCVVVSGKRHVSRIAEAPSCSTPKQRLDPRASYSPGQTTRVRGRVGTPRPVHSNGDGRVLLQPCVELGSQRPTPGWTQIRQHSPAPAIPASPRSRHAPVFQTLMPRSDSRM